MKLDCINKLAVKLCRSTTGILKSTRHKAYDALGIVVLGGEGGERHNFSRHMLQHIKTFVRTMRISLKDLSHMSKEHVVTSAEPR